MLSENNETNWSCLKCGSINNNITNGELEVKCTKCGAERPDKYLEKAANIIQTEQLFMPDDWYYIAFFHEDRIIEAAGPEGGIYLHREQAEQYCVLTVKESGKIAYREYFHHSQDAYAYFIEELRCMARAYRSVPKQSSNTSNLSSSCRSVSKQSSDTSKASSIISKIKQLLFTFFNIVFFLFFSFDCL